MIREIKEYIEFTESESKLINEFRIMLEDYCEAIEKEDAFPTLSDTYLDAQHLLEHINVFIRKYI